MTCRWWWTTDRLEDKCMNPKEESRFMNIPQESEIISLCYWMIDKQPHANEVQTPELHLWAGPITHACYQCTLRPAGWHHLAAQVYLTLSCFLIKVNSPIFLNFSLNPMLFWRLKTSISNWCILNIQNIAPASSMKTCSIQTVCWIV